MRATLYSLALMLAGPPAVLLAWAHWLRSGPLGSETGEIVAMVAAVVVGLTGLAFAPWPRATKEKIGVAYAIAAVLLLPLATLLAVCTTGDCL
ncbi:hypothetical protein [Sandarakinorhabdus oryzae]|uniref:hypothetical protein n=1 Tax=Sandarakinorhabdus oryzae TaxID=2675220 RepID=UPI0012E1DC0E|nr:hypothetical protein [Sandarakinorhabdus oryzae]